MNMYLSYCRITQRALLYTSSFLFFLLLLAACSDAGANPASSNLPSTALSALASSQPTQAATLKMYTGNNFSITYPQSWRMQGSGNQIIFQDAQGLNALTV